MGIVEAQATAKAPGVVDGSTLLRGLTPLLMLKVAELFDLDRPTLLRWQHCMDRKNLGLNASLLDARTGDKGRWMDRRMDGWIMDGWMDGWSDGRMEGCTWQRCSLLPFVHCVWLCCCIASLLIPRPPPPPPPRGEI